MLKCINLLERNKFGITILLPNNSNKSQYKQYVNIGRKYYFGSIILYSTSFEIFKNKMGLLLLLICLQNVFNRTKCKENSHPAFDELELDKQMAITLHVILVYI